MFMAYTGRYEFDGHRLTTATSPAFETPQVRHVRFPMPTGSFSVRRQALWAQAKTSRARSCIAAPLVSVV
jgi:hypothetical protein